MGPDDVQALKTVGLDDRAVLDLTLVTAYFAFVNRVVLGLGVRSEGDEASGYRYDEEPEDLDVEVAAQRG